MAGEAPCPYRIYRVSGRPIFAAPLSELANPRLAEEREVRINGQKRTLRIYHVGRFVVWGVTARILENLLTRLGIASTYGIEEG